MTQAESLENVWSPLGHALPHFSLLRSEHSGSRNDCAVSSTMSLTCIANAKWLVLFVNTLPVATVALPICTSSIKPSKWKRVVCDQMGHEEGGAQPTLKQQPSSIKECFVLASPISGGKAPGGVASRWARWILSFSCSPVLSLGHEGCSVMWGRSLAAVWSSCR